MEYLRLFENDLEHDDCYDSIECYSEPWVGYTIESENVTYNKRHTLPFEPSLNSVTYKDNCNAEEYARFQECLTKASATMSSFDRRVFDYKMVTMTETDEYVRFTANDFADQSCINSDLFMMMFYVAGVYRFNKNSENSYSVQSTWTEGTSPEAS